MTSNYVTLDNQGADTGGRGTREDLVKKPEDENRGRDADEYNISTYTIHTMNLNLSSTKEITMGRGGLKKLTALQFLHSAYNLLQAYREEECDSVWTLINTQ